MADQVKADTIKDSLARAVLAPGRAENLVGDFKPTVNLEVSFVGKAVDFGTTFRASECKVAPAVAFRAEAEAGSRAVYTLVMVDCDDQKSGEGFFRHWVLPGLSPLASSSDTIVAETKWALTPYQGPAPDSESSPHRYLFLLYREPRNLDLTKDQLGGDELDQRQDFKPTVFAEKYGLVLVGLNWMTCTAD